MSKLLGFDLKISKITPNYLSFSTVSEVVIIPEKKSVQATGIKHFD
jgi:hypothetical protein